MNFDLERFKKAQERDYQTALKEIMEGHKQSHWIWYIFPQLKELGYSSTAKYYGLTVDEAKAYIADEVLKNRLIEISEALMTLESNNATEVMGYPDDLKLNSCMTLFSELAPEIQTFQNVLNKFYSGKKDLRTLDILKKN